MSKWADGCKVYENCRICQRRATHPPVLAVYDDTERDYIQPPAHVCTALWASTNGDHAAGSICGREATRRAGDVRLCDHHYERLMNWRYYEEPMEDVQRQAKVLREADAEYAQVVAESAAYREKIKAQMSVVYYLRRVSDGLIKIGTTTAFKKRMATHRNEHGEIQILLTTSGGLAEEQAVHRMFDVYRAGPGRTEWFHPTRPLLNWICDARSVEKYRTTQDPAVLPVAEIRKLIKATPPDAYQWRRGRLVPVRQAADPAA